METSPHSPRPVDSIAWAAGLFEGEGCFNVTTRKSGKIQIQARLGMTDGDVVERFRVVMGCGTIKQSQRGAAHHKPMFEWSIYEAEHVRDVIAALLPYLGTRRSAKAREVLDLGAGVESHNNKKTHCPQGHLLMGDNLVLEPFVAKNGKNYIARRCKECRVVQTRERARKRLGTLPENYRIKE